MTATTRSYSLRSGKHGGWARIWITGDGCFSCISDYGNYAYRWSRPDEEFRRFLCGVDDDYLKNKLGAGNRRYDGEATRDALRRAVCRRRRDGSLSQDSARADWREIDRLDTHSEFALGCWYANAQLSRQLDQELYEGIVQYRHSGQLEAFIQRVWPRFVALLREELATEPTA